MRGMPAVRYVCASEFMHRLEEQAREGALPEYRGELYLELHRGTLTQMHDIKRNNRKAEIALHDMEFANVYARKPKERTDGRAIQDFAAKPVPRHSAGHVDRQRQRARPSGKCRTLSSVRGRTQGAIS